MEAIHTRLDVARAEATRWLGEWHPLVHQIAPGEGITAPLSEPAVETTLDTPTALHAFLSNYKQSVLVPFELPAVLRACQFTVRNEMKELLELDRTMAQAPWLQSQRADSRASGRLHLERLKPLRDQRGIQRYTRAVDQGEANGWHFLVVGAALGLYALPPRQGLMDYALHTFWSVVARAPAKANVDSDEAVALVDDLASDLPQHIRAMFPATRLSAL